MKDFQTLISSYRDFPRKGIIFKDLLGILQDPESFRELIYMMSENEIIKKDTVLVPLFDSFGKPIQNNIGNTQFFNVDYLNNINFTKEGINGDILPTKRAFLMGNPLVVGIVEKIGLELSTKI